MWRGMAKTCPSLRKATRCTPGWWWLCWTRTENGKRWVSHRELNERRGGMRGVDHTGAPMTPFPRTFLTELLQTPSRGQGQTFLGTGQTHIVWCNGNALPRWTAVMVCCSLCLLLRSQEEGLWKDLGEFKDDVQFTSLQEQMLTNQQWLHQFA